MTNEVKKKIIDLRKLGYGYKKIASELNIKISAARYVCNKFDESNQLIGFCKNCGKEIVSKPDKKKREYCSDKCRWSWNRKNRNESKMLFGRCLYCRKAIYYYPSDNKKYCSKECFYNAMRSKK